MDKQEILRKSFSSQLERADIIYKDLFEEGNDLYERLFREFTDLKPEPDLDAYIEYRFTQEGIKIVDWDMNFIEENKAQINLIYREFIAIENIAPEHCRPQLEQTEIFAQFEDLRSWRDVLIKSIINRDLNTVVKEIPARIKSLKVVFNRLDQPIADWVAERIINDDLADDLKTLCYINKLGDVAADSFVNEKLGSWRDVRGLYQFEIRAIMNQQNHTIEFAQKKSRPSLSIKQIALVYVYRGLLITRDNGDETVRKYGHTSGEKLFQEFSRFSSRANRTGRPTPCTPQKLNNKIKLLESVIGLLPDDRKKEPIDEVSILKNIFESEYQ